VVAGWEAGVVSSDLAGANEMLTREGREIAPPGAPIRTAMHSGGLCKTCVHCLDMCDSQHKRFGGDSQFRWVTWCKGYESIVQDAKT
jgi:hypothetical protein